MSRRARKTTHGGRWQAPKKARAARGQRAGLPPRYDFTMAGTPDGIDRSSWRFRGFPIGY